MTSIVVPPATNETASCLYRSESFATQQIARCPALLIAACIAVVSSAAEPMLRNTSIVPLRLPRNYEPADLQKQALDEEIRIGVVLPSFDRHRSASWTTPVSWIGEVDPETRVQRETAFEIDVVIVNAAEPIATVLPRIFRRLFPQSTILNRPECPTCDVIFIVDAGSQAVTSHRNIAQLKVVLSLTAVTPDGTTVTSFSAEGTGREARAVAWSTETAVRGMGALALRDAMERLFAALVTDPSLSSFIRNRNSERARPCDLATNVDFDDAASFLPNGRLDAGEQARLRFAVRNDGGGPAFAVRLRITTASRKISLQSTDIDVGDIASGETKKVDVMLTAGSDIESAHDQLNIETIERRGFGGRPVVVTLATEQLRRPTLEIADIRLEDRGGRTQADGDGHAANGETLEAVVLVRNSGPGDAAGVAVTFSAVPGIEVVEPSMNVGPIAVNAVKEVRTLLHIPTTFDGPDVALTLRAVEVRGESVAVVEKQHRWPVQLKRPRVEIGFRVFDGNSPRSAGNRDGIASNGETLEVALMPSNRGLLTARGVRLTLTSPVVGLSVKPATVDVGELPPLSEGMEHRVQVIIPRSVDRGDVLQRLPVNVAISQTDFAVGEQSIGLPFSMQHPELVAAVTSPSSLVEGKPAFFTLDIRNQGLLTAEDVRVDITSDNAAVELFDASGAPTRTVRIDVGSISPQTAVGRIQLKGYVRRNASAITGLLKAFISQRDFGTAAVETALTLLRDEPTRISTVPAMQPPPATLRTAGVPATVSFQRYRDGSRVSDEMVALAFEVQSQTPVELVRLEQNRRALELPENAPIRNEEIYRWQYEPQVHLDYGANEFEVVVITSEGVSSSRSMTLHREKPRGRIWLAVVGVSEYRDPSLADLDFAKDDAVAVHSLYRQLGIPDEQVIKLLDQEATLANIKRSLGTDLVKHATNPDDTVLIYFAGHGEREADRSSADSDGYSKYLLPHDVRPDDLFGSALSMEELSRILQRLRSERVVLIIDSCFSGAAGGRTPFEPTAGSRGVTSAEFLSRMANAGKGRVILTASDSHEVAQESSNRRHGIFTYFLLEGLRGAADIDHDGRIDVDEIYKFVSQKVSSATRGLQNPMRKSPNLSGTLVLGGRLQ
jgi:hypothetical protein